MILAILTGFAYVSRAQAITEMFQPVEFSVGMDARAGVNISNMVFYPKGAAHYRLDRMCGFNAGVGVDFHLLQGLSVDTGLVLTSRGGKDKQLGNDYFPVYAKVPVALSLTVGVVDGVRAYITGGVFGEYGVFGSSRTSTGAVLDFFGSGTDNIANRLDAGWLAGFGVTLYDRFRIGFQYEYGLVNIANEPTKKDFGYFFNSTMSFHVGYFLF